MTISINELFKKSFVITIDQNRYDLFCKIFNYHGLPIPQKFEGFQFKEYLIRQKNKLFQSVKIHSGINCSYSHAAII